jgi:ABC-type transport system substrate-binding protein
MESARKVRWALAMTIDQQSIIDNILDGRGRVNYAWENILPNDPTHKDSWVIPYDTDKARQFMADAGYPDGFDMEMWNYSNGSPGTISAANAVAAAWRTELGIEVSIDGTEYGTRRPQTVDKSINVPFVHGINWIPGSTAARYICPGQGQVVGFTMDDEQCDLGLSNATEASLEVRIDNNIANQDYLTEWMLFVPMFQAPAILFVVSPNIESWTPYNAQDVLPNNLESMTLK